MEAEWYRGGEVELERTEVPKCDKKKKKAKARFISREQMTKEKRENSVRVCVKQGTQDCRVGGGRVIRKRGG